MNFRDPNKAITNFPSILVRRNVQHPCSKIIEFSIPLPRRIESINMPANELSIKPADHQFLHQPKHNQPVHPSYRVTWRAHTYTHTHTQGQEIEPPLYIDIDSGGRGLKRVPVNRPRMNAENRGIFQSCVTGLRRGRAGRIDLRRRGQDVEREGPRGGVAGQAARRA